MLSVAVQALQASRAATTSKAYTYAFRRFQRWCSDLGVSSLPAAPGTAGIYIAQFAKQKTGKQTAVTAASAITWFHRACNLPSPLRSPMAREILSGTVRILARPSNPKKAMQSQIVYRIIETILAKNKNRHLIASRLAVFVLVTFFGFLRASEALSLQISDVKFKKKHMEINIKKSKTDQMYTGDVIKVTASPSLYHCPVYQTASYICALTKAGSEPDSPLFPRIRANKNSTVPLPKQISYTTIREQFLQSLRDAGISNEAYGIHSLRSGGATTAARAGVDHRLIKAHGRWKTEAGKQPYIRSDTLELLQASKALL